MSRRQSKSPYEDDASSYDYFAVCVGNLSLYDSDDESSSEKRKKTRKKMTSWKSYEKAADRAPLSPGVYEFRYRGTKDPIYIGESGKIRERIKNHRYGTQEIDKAIKDGGGEEIEVRYKEMDSKNDARDEERRRIANFERKHGKTPLYNLNH